MNIDFVPTNASSTAPLTVPTGEQVRLVRGQVDAPAAGLSRRVVAATTADSIGILIVDSAPDGVAALTVRAYVAGTWSTPATMTVRRAGSRAVELVVRAAGHEPVLVPVANDKYCSEDCNLSSAVAGTAAGIACGILTLPGGPVSVVGCGVLGGAVGYWAGDNCEQAHFCVPRVYIDRLMCYSVSPGCRIFGSVTSQGPLNGPPDPGYYYDNSGNYSYIDATKISYKRGVGGETGAAHLVSESSGFYTYIFQHDLIGHLFTCAPGVFVSASVTIEGGTSNSLSAPCGA